ncbi:hypothetical protein B0H14DRAFT_2812099 [Mycena olivaceomarginata]|nr:hypothetical protein B0H14DRAFT_2812099 [Mycena olivaceomarginata]
MLYSRPEVDRLLAAIWQSWSTKVSSDPPRLPYHLIPPQPQTNLTDEAHSDSLPSIAFLCFGIHQAPPGLSKKEFETGIETLVANWLELPIIKINALKMDMIFSNDLLEAQVKAAGLPDSRPFAIIKTEYETERVHILVQVMQHQRVAEAIQAGARSLRVLGGGHNTNRQPGSKGRAHGIAILKVPAGESPEHFARKLEALLDRSVALPATQKCVSKCTLFAHEKSLENQLNAMGIHTPGRTFVIHMEYESLSHSMEMLLGDAVRDLRVNLVDVSPTLFYQEVEVDLRSRVYETSS